MKMVIAITALGVLTGCGVLQRSMPYTERGQDLAPRGMNYSFTKPTYEYRLGTPTGRTLEQGR